MVDDMRTSTRLGIFAVVLALAFGAGAGLGSVAGPIDVGGDEQHEPAHGSHEDEAP
jgi:hypothetical protein